MIYTYNDAYLKNNVTQDREDRATLDVNAIATFAADWKQKLIILRAYILVCLECQAQPDDLFSQKLKQYRQEWESTLAAAKAATVDTEGNPLHSMTISLERA